MFNFGDCVIAFRNDATYYGYVLASTAKAVMINYFHDVNKGYRTLVFHINKVEHSDWDNGWGKDSQEKIEHLTEALQEAKETRIAA